MTPSPHTTVLTTTLLVVGTLACGSEPPKDTCVQVGPPQGYPLRDLDAFIATGHPQDMPTDTSLSFYGGDFALLPPNLYPKLRFDANPPDHPNYRWVAWVDPFLYTDGGQPPWLTYCADARDAGCAPQPGQLHGEVVMTLREGADNVVVIPLGQ